MKMFENLVSTILNSGLATAQEIQPCSEEDVISFKESTGSILPLAYEQFLIKIGRGAGCFMQGTDMFYPGVKGLRNEAITLLKENEEEFELPEGAIVFSMHQGYEFLYFIVSEGDDPGVYQYVEGNGAPEKVWSSFSKFIEQILNQHIQSS